MNPVLWIGAGAAVSIAATVVALFLLGRVRARSGLDSWDALFPRPAPPAAPSSRAPSGPVRGSGRRAG